GWLSRKITQTTVILDGFPRTVGQAEGLLALLRSYEGQGHLKVVRLSIENERVIERIVGRAVCSNKDCQSVYSLLQGSALAPRKAMVCDLCEHTLIRRSDDTVETIRERLSIYYSHEQNLLDFFKEKDQEVLEINVERPLKDVFTELKNRFIEKTV
ncbi:MAG: nucleoside monophosphate kinase, partial [Candidatus Babeliales bacterium]